MKERRIPRRDHAKVDRAPRSHSGSGRDDISGSETVAAAEFKARCLELLDRVRQGRRSIVVTKHGKPVARLIPYEPEPAPILGCMEGSVTYAGDIVAPIGEPWEADAG